MLKSEEDQDFCRAEKEIDLSYTGETDQRQLSRNKGLMASLNQPTTRTDD